MEPKTLDGDNEAPPLINPCGTQDEVGVNAPLNDSDANFLTLPAFRMMCLSNPLLDTFFASQLPASFKLEAPHRASVNGTSIWHDISSPNTPMSAGTTLTGSTSFKTPEINQSPASAPASTTSFSASNNSGRAYSKDVSTGVVGRLGGFLNNFLGEDVKAKVDDLADSLGSALNTKVVRGPLPSFANLEEDETLGNASSHGLLGKKKSSVMLGMDDLKALEEKRRENRKMREEEERQEEAEAKAAADSKDSRLKGIDINAAQESLRLATEAIVEGTQTSGQQFGDEESELPEE